MSRVRGEHSVKHAQTQEWLLKRTGRKRLKNARISFHPKSCDLKLHENFRDPLISPSGRKVCGVEKGKKEEEKFPLALMGVLAPGSAHARPSNSPPIDLRENFPAHMSAESASNISPNPSEVKSEVSEH